MRGDERIRAGLPSAPGVGRRPRDPEKTQALILAAAKAVFARVGLGGARIETIAEEGGVNKRLIYQYFESKDQLFQRVLEDAWHDIRSAEAKLDLEHFPPVEAIRALMSFTWEYYQQHPEFMSLVNSANLHRARHLKDSEAFQHTHQGFTPMLQNILDRGVQSGEFRPDIDAAQLHLTLAAIAYYYLNNRHTGELIFGFDFTSPEALKKRFEFNLQTILSLIRAQ
ncbi:HTH-type transcriptional repressor NicS [compost metagenome]